MEEMGESHLSLFHGSTSFFFNRLHALDWESGTWIFTFSLSPSCVLCPRASSCGIKTPFKPSLNDCTVSSGLAYVKVLQKLENAKCMVTAFPVSSLEHADAT